MYQEQTVLGHLTDVLRRRRSYALSCFVLVLAATALVTFTTTPVYRARAVVQIEQPSGFILRTDFFGAGLAHTIPQEQAELLETYPYKLLVDSLVTIAEHQGIQLAHYGHSDKIRHLFEKELCNNPGALDLQSCVLTRAAQLEGRAPQVPKRERDMEQEIRARLIEDTGLIELFGEAHSPRRAQDAANAAAICMVWQNEQVRKEEARYTVRFIRQQLDAPDGVRAQLARVDEQLASFKRQKAFLHADEEMRALLSQMVEVSTRRWQGVLRLTDLRQRLAATRERLGQEPSTLVSPTIYENPTVQEIKKQLVSAEAELLSLQAQFTDEHPRVQSALARVEGLRERLRGEASRIESVQRMPNPVHQELYKNAALLSADIIGQEAQQRAMEEILQDLQQRMLAVPELEKQLTQLLRQRQVLEKRYLLLMERLQEAELTEAVQLGNTRVVELAQLPGERVKPRRILNLLMGSVLGALLAIGFALLMEQLDRRLPSASLAARWLEAPLLGSIPSVRDGALTPALTEIAAVEAFRHLRTAIRLAAMEQTLRVLMVASPSTGDGKTFIARHLAVSMAQSGQRTVLIDADLRAPMQHRLENLPPSPGLTDLLRGESTLEQCLRASNVAGLWLIPAGADTPNPTELLESMRMQELLTQMRERCDMVILDAPPMESVADARVLALYSDAVLLVVRPGATPREPALHAVEMLRTLPNTRLLGIVANRVPLSASNHLPYPPATRRKPS
ncbi:MAG: polysaccharide biosynthesis tyrosine autokinase [Armatimonadota bacterium]|nr:polysaccharide biosynthesis tyrosine autokinase [Armatimonadota bacterium]